MPVSTFTSALPAGAEFDFSDLAPQTKLVTYRGRKYLLSEATEAAAVAYDNCRARSVRLSDGKVTGIEGAADVEPLLVSMCLAPANDDGAVLLRRDGSPETVTVEFVRSMPARIVKPMFEWVKEVSGLDADDDEKSLLAQRAKLDERIRDLRARKGESEGKGPQPGMTGTSDSPNGSASTYTS